MVNKKPLPLVPSPLGVQDGRQRYKKYTRTALSLDIEVVVHTIPTAQFLYSGDASSQMSRTGQDGTGLLLLDNADLLESRGLLGSQEFTPPPWA
jgi:hypothetical protein